MKAKLLDYVVMIEGKTSLERKKIILNFLKSKKYSYYEEKYNSMGFEGVNIILEFGKGKKEILATTHYDVVPGSPGANDCGSCIAVLLDLSRRLKNYEPKNKIKIIIFGDEEPGCIGSRAYIRKHGLNNLIAVYNMELVGMGDVVGIWPVTKDCESNIALTNLKDTLESMNQPYEEAANLPMFFADHTPFRERGFKGAFCLSMVPHEEINEIREFVESHPTKIMAKYYLGSIIKPLKLRIPKMFQLYHTSEDKSKYLSESSLELISNIMYKAIKKLDKKSI